MRTVTVTKKERKFIERLEKLLATAPDSLWLFGWSGTLCVLKEDAEKHPCVVANGFKMSGDGGDPIDNEVSQNVEVVYLP